MMEATRAELTEECGSLDLKHTGQTDDDLRRTLLAWHRHRMSLGQ
jgi:hypothetical protein